MPSFASIQELQTAISQLGYTEFEKKSSRKLVILLPRGGDRAGTLDQVATKYKSYGGKYNDKSSESSVGRSEFTGGYTVLAKIKGGGGSGAGSSLTKLTESAQCVYNACHYAGDKFTNANLKKHSSKADTDEQFDNILNKLPDDWIVSSKLIAEKLKKQFPDRGKGYVHHRGSSWVNTLESHWKTLNTEAGKPFANLNKWSPADIWIVSSAGSRVDLTSTNNIVELNELLVEKLKSKDIIGVSLKKVVNIANYKELNVGFNRPTYNFESTTTGLRGFFQSNDGYMMFDGGKAQFRTFGSTWQGELKGKNANMGKVSGGPIESIIRIQFKKNFVPQRELASRTDDNMKQFYSWYTSIPYHNDMSYDDFYAESTKKDQTWYISKIMTTQLMSIVESFSSKQKDEFASALVNYAGSESVLSGPYVKVY